MDRFDRDDNRTNQPEGVRIIGADEAAEAFERGDVARRRRSNEPRYGDRPSPPAADGPRPVLRFPLGGAAETEDLTSVPEPISEPVDLPHWTQPPTGQVPQILDSSGSNEGSDDWASLSGSAPRWRDDDSGREADVFGDLAGWDEGGSRLGALDDSERQSHDDFFSFADIDEGMAPSRSVFADVEEERAGAWEDDAFGEPEGVAPPPAPRRVASGQRVGRGPAAPPRGARPAAPGVGGGGGGSDRDLGQAAIVGVGFLALALIMFKIGPLAALVLVTAVIGLAVAELYSVMRQAGYEPVALAGITGTVGMIIASYNYGYGAIPTVMFLTTAVCLLWYLVGAGTETPVMNIGVTLLGVCWVGMFGSFAAFMLAIGDPGLGILMAAILGTVGYDVGGLFVGRNAGRQPLSAASPNKTVEGLAGGCVIAFVIVVLLSAVVGLGPIEGIADGAMVGLAVALFAPLGDLCESLIKRDLGVKDMGSILPGHGGLLDRFDGLLFVLPAVWLVASVKDFFFT
jgi:phosphatidate cytidylyltransferase